MRIRLAVGDDAAAAASLYAPYVTDGAVSFETEAPDAATMGERIAAGGAFHPWLVACDDDGRLLGFASATPFRARAAYRFTVETSIYLDAAATGRGIGRRLYGRLIELATAQGYVQAIGAVSLPNPASVAFHEALGFTRAGLYRDVGWKLGAWHSVELWQRALAPATHHPGPIRPIKEAWAS